MSFFLTMFIYSFSMGITPGPNNLIALTTGVNYGFVRALPFTFGVVIGFNLLLAVIGFGVGGVIAENAEIMELLGYAGIAFIIYIGIKIATAPMEIKEADNKNPGFIHGLLFQWINPKAWTACVGGIGAFNLADNTPGMFLYIAVSTFVVLFCVGIWAYAGSKIINFLQNERNHRAFNLVMGGSLLVLAVYLLMTDF